MVTPLPSSELRSRAQRIRLVLTDVDGVLTDTGVYYSAEGEQLKRFSIRDGMGVALLRNAGIDVGIVTGERSGSVQRRAEKLGIEELHLGIADKKGVLDRVLDRRGLSVDQVAYIGDDVNDLSILEAVHPLGLTGAPQDAIADVASRVHHVCRFRGGMGAFRDFSDWILGLRAPSPKP